MTIYALRAVPWRLVGLVCPVVVLLLALAARWPNELWPLQGIALALIVAAAAWSMDEVAAAVVDTAPRSLRWRTVARAAAAAPLALTWATCVLVAREHLPPHPGLFLLQGGAGLLAAIGLTTWRRSRGLATPGATIALVALPALATMALARPAPELLPVFPIWPGEAWGLSIVLWSTTAVAAAALLALAARRA